jgi:cellobiose dehydrogenase (acceptor)
MPSLSTNVRETNNKANAIKCNQSWLEGTNLTRVDVPGLYKSIFADGNGLMCNSSVVAAYGGCNIGGSSSVNAGLFFEPPASDYDLYFPDGWKSADMKNATRRLYAKQPSTNITSQNGIRYLPSGYNAARKWIVDGLAFSDVDINAAADQKTQVFGHPIFDYSNGQRGGPVINYLQDALKSGKLTLQSGVQVVRVARNACHAKGVTALVNGTETLIKIKPNGQVILSAGAIASPGLLMHSGIGDHNTLTTLAAAGKLAANMTWINNTAVGAGLFDNPNTFIELSGDSIQSYTHNYSHPVKADADMYIANRTGPYTFASETSVFWDTITRADGTRAGLQGTIDSSGYTDYTSNNTITLNVYGTSGLLSSGAVILNADLVPTSNDKVYYSNPQDALDIATFIHKIFAALPGSGLTSLNIAQNSTVAQIQTYITTSSAYARGQVNHWSSSCRIGKCVDKDLKVVGMSNLYVVDGSIVAPLTVNPQFGIMAAAEKGAELILANRGLEINLARKINLGVEINLEVSI